MGIFFWGAFLHLPNVRQYGVLLLQELQNILKNLFNMYENPHQKNMCNGSGN